MMKKMMNNHLFFHHYINGDNMYYINIFFIYSIIGYLFEIFIHLINGYNGGILYGFWTPVYGVGSIVVIYIYNRWIAKINKHKIIKFFLIFLSSFLILSLIEYISGIAIELVLHKTLWNYSKYKFNIGKYICLEMSLLWGLSSLILIYFLKIQTDKIAKKIPKYITWILILLFVIDLCCTLLFKN